jgi:hypothetical protein
VEVNNGMLGQPTEQLVKFTMIIEHEAVAVFAAKAGSFGDANERRQRGCLTGKMDLDSAALLQLTHFFQVD